MKDRLVSDLIFIQKPRDSESPGELVTREHIHEGRDCGTVTLCLCEI
jgi:hypothetical protein